MDDNGSGIYLQSFPVDLTVEYARRAETAGFEGVWLSEIIFGDAIVPATAIALQTERIDVATGIVGLWARSPMTTAMTAANLHCVAGGRFVLGVGLQSRTYLDNWHGATYERPLRAIREWVSIVRPIVDGGVADVDGEIFRTRGFQLMMPPADARARLYLAAIDALTLAGSPDHVRKRIAAVRSAGATTVVLNPSAPDVWFPLYEGHFPDGTELPPFDFPAFLGVVERTIDSLGAA